MIRSVRSALVNALLLVASLGVTYAVASFVVFRFLLPHLSLNLNPHFPDLAEVFAQTSKAGTVPRDYIALLGDSYAAGQGDGLLAAQGDRAKHVHSAHVLHRLSGRDVISLGIGGAGSAQAMVRMPARILLGGCLLYPRLEAPRQIIVYFYEGNDLDENKLILARVAERGSVIHDTIARYVTQTYAAPPALRCFNDLGETTLKMAYFLLTNTQTWQTLRKPSAHNRVMAGDAPHPAPVLQKPLLEEFDSRIIEASLMVYDVSLHWLARNFPFAATTVVYLPSPAAVYRHADASVDAYVRWPLNEVQAVSAAAVYEASQSICEKIRALTLARGVRFIDARPVLRAAAAKSVLHGPQDWNHFNDEGYQVLGAFVARAINDIAGNECMNWSAPQR